MPKRLRDECQDDIEYTNVSRYHCTVRLSVTLSVVSTRLPLAIYRPGPDHSVCNVTRPTMSGAPKFRTSSESVRDQFGMRTSEVQNLSWLKYSKKEQLLNANILKWLCGETKCRFPKRSLFNRQIANEIISLAEVILNILNNLENHQSARCQECIDSLAPFITSFWKSKFSFRLASAIRCTARP